MARTHLSFLFVSLCALTTLARATLPCNMYAKERYGYMTTYPTDFCMDLQYSNRLYYCSGEELYQRDFTDPDVDGCEGTHTDQNACDEYAKLRGECLATCDKATCSPILVQYMVHDAKSCDEVDLDAASKQSTEISVPGYCYPAGTSNEFNIIACDNAKGTYTIAKYTDEDCTGEPYHTYEHDLGYQCNPSNMFAYQWKCVDISGVPTSPSSPPGPAAPSTAANRPSTSAPPAVAPSMSNGCNTPNAADVSCDWYPHCLESFKTCGASGYALGYGFKYCSLYEQHLSEFTDHGQQWVNNVKLCLQLHLADIIQSDPNQITCDAIKSKAFATHPQCYLGEIGSISICDLSPAEWWSILEIVNIGLFYPDPFKSVPQMLQVMAQCSYKLTYQFVLKLGIESGKTFDSVIDGVEETSSSVWEWASGVVHDLFGVESEGNVLGVSMETVRSGSVEIVFTVLTDTRDEQILNIVNVLQNKMQLVKGQQVVVGNNTSSRVVLTAASLEYNPDSYGDGNSGSSTRAATIVGVVLGAMIILGLGFVGIYVYRKRKQKNNASNTSYVQM